MDKYYPESAVNKMLQDAYENGFDGPLELMYEAVATILDQYRDDVVSLKHKQQKLPEYTLRSSE
jgi:hypothetical protein